MLLRLLLLDFCAFASANSPEVITGQGTLRGLEEKTWSGRTFNSFTGIPYAEPPVGELRFKPPVPANAWEGVLDASKPPPLCPQINFFLKDYTPKGQEDCLYLNVYTPQLLGENKKPLPVLFFIHGGGFMNGKSDFYGPHILLDKDVVLVTINYRLGTLGFLSTGDLVVPGNNGLKDQSLAIKWVKENIAHFGGNPNQITIFGQSAGGVSVHYHMLSPLSRDLIHGVIAQSGTALGLWAFEAENKHNTKRLAGMLDCPTGSSQAIVDCLRKVDALEIVDQNAKFFEWMYDPLVVFKPVVEPEHEGAFLSKHPVEVIKSGKVAKVPFMVGLTSEDGAFKSASIYNDSTLVKQLDDEFDRIAPITLMYRESAPNKDEVTEKIRKFYYGDKHIDESTKKELTEMYTDFWFLISAESAVRMHFKYSSQAVYYYLFNYRGSKSLAKLLGDPEHEYGVCHCDDLLYLFDMVFFPDYKPTDADKEMAEKMTAMFVNFATTGNPTPADDSRFPEKWQPVQSDSLEYYKIRSSSDMTMEDHLFKKRSDFWKSLPLGGTEKGIANEF